MLLTRQSTNRSSQVNKCKRHHHARSYSKKWPKALPVAFMHSNGFFCQASQIKSFSELFESQSFSVLKLELAFIGSVSEGKNYELCPSPTTKAKNVIRYVL